MGLKMSKVIFTLAKIPVHKLPDDFEAAEYLEKNGVEGPFTDTQIYDAKDSIIDEMMLECPVASGSNLDLLSLSFDLEWGKALGCILKPNPKASETCHGMISAQLSRRRQTGSYHISGIRPNGSPIELWIDVIDFDPAKEEVPSEISGLFSKEGFLEADKRYEERLKNPPRRRRRRRRRV